MTSSNGNIFRVTGHLCGEFTGPGEFPTQRPVTRSFDVYFDLHPNKRLSNQSWGWWFETQSGPLWRHRSVNTTSSHFHVHKDSHDRDKAVVRRSVLYHGIHMSLSRFLHIGIHLCSILWTFVKVVHLHVYCCVVIPWIRATFGSWDLLLDM